MQSSPAAAHDDYDSDKKEFYFWEGHFFPFLVWRLLLDIDDEVESSRRRRRQRLRRRSSLVWEVFFVPFFVPVHSTWTGR